MIEKEPQYYTYRLDPTEMTCWYHERKSLAEATRDVLRHRVARVARQAGNEQYRILDIYGCVIDSGKALGPHEFLPMEPYH